MAMNSFISADQVYGKQTAVEFTPSIQITSTGGESCGYPPPRLQHPLFSQCNTYLTGRPHLSMHPFRTAAYPLYPDSNPAHFARKVEHIKGAQWVQPDIVDPNPACMTYDKRDANPLH